MYIHVRSYFTVLQLVLQFMHNKGWQYPKSPPLKANPKGRETGEVVAGWGRLSFCSEKRCTYIELQVGHSGRAFRMPPLPPEIAGEACGWPQLNLKDFP